MFTSFLKITLRNLYREKVYAIINIAGLSIAIACCIILGIYIRGELTYDLHNKKYKKIYRVEQETTINGNVMASAFTSPLLGEILAREYPEIENYVWFWVFGEKSLIRYDDKAIYWENATYASENVFEVFDHNIIFGDLKTAKAGTAAVSETFAHKYFGNENPVGKIIYSEGGPIKISIVFADLPENTHIRYDVLFLNNSKTMKHQPDNPEVRKKLMWWPRYYTYFLMPEHYDIKRFKNISDSFFEHYMAEQGKLTNSSWRSWLTQLGDIHYHSNVGQDQPTGNISFIYGYAAVAIFLLLIASINYMNLSTAMTAKRKKEVGMRKILGSGRKQLIFQFLGETFFISFIALFLGLVLVEVILNFTSINELIGKSLSLHMLKEPWQLGMLLICNLVFGLLSGFYPAFYLSSIIPLSAFKKNHHVGKGSLHLRETLIFIQFTISVCVIACTFIMFVQMRYISNKALGFNKENRLIITLHGTDIAIKIPTIKKELSKTSNILGTSLTSTMIGTDYGITSAGIVNNDNVIEATLVNFLEIDNDFIDVMGLEFVTSKDPPKEKMSSKEPLYIVNEVMVKNRGWENPLDKKIFTRNGEKPVRVIGVVKDFNYYSLHKPIAPLVLKILPSGKFQNMINYLVVKIKGEDTPGTINFLKEKFNEFDPVHPLEFAFLDETLNHLYFSEQNEMRLIGIFAAVCILISCLGIFGLTTFSTEQRTKEIGTRKALGATTWQIIAMFSKRILLLVIGGAIFASLGAYFVMDEWLTRFSYKIDIELWVFLIATAVVALPAFMAVTVQAFRAAQANPVEALRYE